jgi:hypothetical protein
MDNRELDFYLEGCLKENVYAMEVQSLTPLVICIEVAVANIMIQPSKVANFMNSIHCFYETYIQGRENKTEGLLRYIFNVGSKTAVFWDIFTVVTMKDVVFWDMTPCGCSKKNGCFGGTYHLHLQDNRTLSLPSSQRGCAS